jgi:hypothetical protein
MTLQLLARPALASSSTLLATSSLRATLITASGSAHPTLLSRSRSRHRHHAASSCSSRAFGSASTSYVQAGRTNNASTALKESVKHREEERDVGVVGDEGKGAEGPHYQGEHYMSDA